jgi:hypothetical protein
MRLTYNNYKSNQFICSKCNWTGLGSAAFLGDLSELHTFRDIECPKCDTTLYTIDLGIDVVPPSIDENDESNINTPI